MKITKHLAAYAAALSAIALFGSTANAVVEQGNPYVPPGADFQIFALQGIDSSNPMGQSGFSQQVNTDFEMTPSIGVSYDQGGGSLKDFGIGLYTNSASQVESTGLNIKYNQLVDAASVTITVEDFDLKADKSTYFNTKKVEPSILIFGSNGSVYASALPTNIFSLLTPNTTVKSSDKGADIWDLNLGQLLTALGKSDTAISGFMLYADALNGEIPSSDPYLLVSAGNGIVVVPEASNYLVGMAAFAILGVSHLTFLRRKKATAQGRS